MSNPRIIAIGTANPPVRLTQEQTFHAAGYRTERIRKMFLNSDIDFRQMGIRFTHHAPLGSDRCGDDATLSTIACGLVSQTDTHLPPFLPGTGLSRGESSDQLNQRYLRGAMKTGCRAITNCLESSQLTVRDVDFLVVCTCTGYLCPDLGSRLIAHMGFRDNVQRGSMLGLGCAGALPTLQRACDFVRANPTRVALMVAVEICSACYYVDNTLETVVGNAICADGAAAFLLARDPSADHRYPEAVDFETFLDPVQIEEVGLRHQDGKLRIVLGASIHKIAGPMTEKALDRLLHRHRISRSDIHFWVVHPGGRKVIDDLQQYLGLTETQMRFSRHVLRNYGNMSSPTVMFVLDEVVRKGDPHPGDLGVMVGLGPGMAAELALLRW